MRPRHLGLLVALSMVACDDRGPRPGGGGTARQASGGEGEGEGEGEEGAEGEGDPQCPEGSSWADGECQPGQDPGEGEGEGEAQCPEGSSWVDGECQPRQGEESAGRIGDACARNSDCDDRLVCTPQGRCDVECVEDRDCDGAGEGCNDGVCQAPGAECQDSGDCLNDEICDRGLCRGLPDCVFPDDCEDGLSCVDGQCIELGSEGEGEEGEGEEGEGEEGEGEEGEGEEGEGEPPECPGAPGRPAVPADYGQACERASECACDLCFDTAPAGGQGVCSGFCEGDDDCPGLDVCEVIEGLGVCVPNDQGDACRDPAECNFGICLNDPAGDGSVCTLPCDPDRGWLGRCGQGMGCGIVLTAQGGDLWACVPVGGRCVGRAAGGAGPAGCSGSRCMPDRLGAQEGYCTNDCLGSAHCDLGMTCCGVPDEAGCPVGVCVRGGCPAECRGDADCPEGFGCFEVDNPDGGQRNMCVALQCLGG